MAKLYKVEMYILDVNEDYSNLEDAVSDMGLTSDLNLNCFNVKEVDIEWHDNIDLNFYNCSVENFRKYFEKD